MGSVTCNGRLGVSDTMASALWSAAALFSVAQDGVDGVNLHTYVGLSNGLFDFTDGAGGWTANVHPIYYGALLFAHAAPAGSRLLRVSLSGPPTLHGWATTGPGPVRHVVLLNDSTSHSAAVVVRGAHGVLGARTAQLARLTRAQRRRPPAASASADAPSAASPPPARCAHRSTIPSAPAAAPFT